VGSLAESLRFEVLNPYGARVWLPVNRMKNAHLATGCGPWHDVQCKMQPWRSALAIILNCFVFVLSENETSLPPWVANEVGSIIKEAEVFYIVF
jgi:hypothetical protein